MTPFEKYIKENKASFEVDKVNPSIWKGIQEGAKPTKDTLVRRLVRWSPVAAAVLFMVFALNKSNKESTPFFTDKMVQAYGFENAESLQSLDSKVVLIKHSEVSVNYKNDLQMLYSQVLTLDSLYQPKIKQFEENGFNEMSAHNILKYYQTKSEILDKLIFEINKINSNEKKFNVASKKTTIDI